MRAEERSSFEKALALLSAEERARAHRFRDAFHLRDDDAIWSVLGVIKGMQSQHEHAVEQVGFDLERAFAKALRAAREGSVPAVWTVELAQTLLMGGLLWLAGLVLMGCTLIALGTAVKYGQVPWSPNTAGQSEGFEMTVRAILNAPIGGLFAIIGALFLVPATVGLAFATRHVPDN